MSYRLHLLNIGYPKYTRIDLIFSITPITIKLYTMKVYMKSKSFCMRSFLKMYFLKLI